MQNCGNGVNLALVHRTNVEVPSEVRQIRHAAVHLDMRGMPPMHCCHRHTRHLGQACKHGARVQCSPAPSLGVRVGEDSEWFGSERTGGTVAAAAARRATLRAAAAKRGRGRRLWSLKRGSERIPE